MIRRAIIIVLDSLGVGEMPDDLVVGDRAQAPFVARVGAFQR